MSDDYTKFGMFERTALAIIFALIVAISFASVRFIMVEHGSIGAESLGPVDTMAELIIGSIFVVMFGRPLYGVVRDLHPIQRVKEVGRRGD